MTANPEQLAEEKVRQRWPDAYVGGSRNEYQIWNGLPLESAKALSRWHHTPEEAWLDAAARLEAEHE